MHFKKKILSIILLIGMAVFCIYGSTLEITGTSREVVDLFEFSRKETIYFWYTDEALTNYINSAAVAFGEREGVRVIPILTDNEDYLKEINESSINDEKPIPDAYIINNDALEKAYMAGLTSEAIDVKGVLNEHHFSQTALDAVTYQREYVAYPFYYQTSALLYNKDYVTVWLEQQAQKLGEAAGTEEGQIVGEVDYSEYNLSNAVSEEGIPLTMEGLLYFADAFDAPEGLESIMRWDVSDIFYNYWIIGNYFTVGGETGDNKNNININNQETISCLAMYQSLNQFFSIAPESVNYESCLQDFINGKIVFTIATTEVLEQLKQAKEEGLFEFEYGISTMPKINDILDSRSLSVTNVVAINGYSPNKELANRFAAYLTDERISDLYDKTGKASANMNVNLSNGMLQTFYQEYSHSVSLPKMMEIGNLWLQLEAMFSKVWNGAEISPLLDALASQVLTQLDL